MYNLFTNSVVAGMTYTGLEKSDRPSLTVWCEVIKNAHQTSILKLFRMNLKVIVVLQTVLKSRLENTSLYI